MILIHTALLSEAQAIIEYFKLIKIHSNPKIFQNKNIILLVSGIGKQNTIDNLNIVFKKNQITKALNIGIAGSGDNSIKIGELFCTNQKLTNINHINLKTIDKPQLPINNQLSTLFDMEGKYFEQVCQKCLDEKDIYIFKIVSDYLSSEIPTKEFVKQLIRQNIKSLEKWI